MKVTTNDVLINVGEVIPLKQINTYNTGLNNWIGYTLLYPEVIEDALAEPLTAIGYFLGFDRIQTFNTRLYVASRTAGRSVTQSFADANFDYVPGMAFANNTQLRQFSPGEGYRFNINRDDSFEFEQGKTR